MNKNLTFAIGLMSGTSLDGVDLVYVQFNNSEFKNFQILFSETIPYNLEWKQMLQNAIDFSEKELESLDKTYGKYLATLVNNFISNFKISKVDFIASHGHTVLHQPEKGITLQIGNGKLIAELTKQKVVCDFRSQDVKLGGQGAPLVPIGDQLLFADYQYCLNLGGFSNISFEIDKERIAFDISPVNIVLNHYVNKFGKEFDDKGEIAAQGKINQKLLKSLNNLDFYHQHFPKSLGLEWVKKNIFPLIDAYEKDIPNILRTFVEHIAIQIAVIIKNCDSILITGGGVFNSFLIERISKLSEVSISLPDKTVIDFKEALIFAFLGLLRINNRVNCLKSVTGASKNHSSGQIFYP